MIVSESWRGK